LLIGEKMLIISEWKPMTLKPWPSEEMGIITNG